MKVKTVMTLVIGVAILTWAIGLTLYVIAELMLKL